MALDQTVQVDLPKHGIAYKKISGKTYVYYVTAAYRNEKGKPTNERVSIGRLDEETGKLIPNRNYYETYLKKPMPVTAGIQDFGVSDVFEKVCKKLGVTTLLRKYFPENAKEMLTAAQYILSEGNVMYYLDEYTQSHQTAGKGRMSNEQCSKTFASLRQEDMQLFFREWMKHKKQTEYVAYDVTSISSYSQNIREVEWGYNRDKERLPQINMGMYYGEESCLPLYYRVYPGSISDKTHLKYMVADNEFINGKRTRFVMDRGFYSKENLQFLTGGGYRFVIALPDSLKYCQEVIEKYGPELINHSEFRLGPGQPYGKSYESTVLGFRMKIHLYYDPAKALRESASLYELLESQENDLKGMEEPPDKKLHYDKYFYINRSKDGKLGFVRNYEAIDKELRTCGFFLIAETDFKKTTAEILEIYRRRDTIEKSFDNLKNELDMKRMRSHSSETAQVKVFVTFLSLIVQAYLLRQLKPYMGENGLTLRNVLLELDKMKTIQYPGSHAPRLLNPLTKRQRDIYGLPEIPVPVCMG